MLQQVYAQIDVNVPENPTDITTLATLFGFLLNLVLAVGFSLTLVMLAMGFVQYILSQGDKAGVEKAQKWVTYAVIGGLGLFLVFALKAIIIQVTGAGDVVVGTNVNI